MAAVAPRPEPELFGIGRRRPVRRRRRAREAAQQHLFQRVEKGAAIVRVQPCHQLRRQVVRAEAVPQDQLARRDERRVTIGIRQRRCRTTHRAARRAAAAQSFELEVARECARVPSEHGRLTLTPPQRQRRRPAEADAEAMVTRITVVAAGDVDGEAAV